MGRKIKPQTAEAKHYNKKRITLVVAALLSVAIVLVTSIILFFIDIDIRHSSLIVILLLIGLLILVLWIKPKVMYYSMQYRYLLLLENAYKPYKVRETFDQKWLDKIILSGFQYAYKHDVFDVLFRIRKTLEKKVFRTYHTLEMITIIKDNDIDFYSDLIEEQYRKIWIEHEAKKRISKQVIIQFKMYDTFTEDIKADLDRVIIFREGINYLISVNCGYFKDDQEIYFLHSNTYFPNLYYKYTVDRLKELTK